MISISAISGAIHTIRQLCRHRGGLPLNMHVPGPNFVNSDVDVVRSTKEASTQEFKGCAACGAWIRAPTNFCSAPRAGLRAQETWGDLGRFDYQGLGVHDVVINNVTCDTFRMPLCFHDSCCS